MAIPKNVHVLVVNRDRSGAPIALDSTKGVAQVAPGEHAEVVLSSEQFEALRAQQRQAVARKPGILRLVDHWLMQNGQRVDMPAPEQTPASDAAAE